MKVSPMPRFRPLPALCLAAVLALPGLAQAQTVADIRAEVDVLNGQVQQLRDELVRQGAAGGLPVAPATALERLDQLEAELRQLTNRVDVLTNDIDRIVKDATNRVGDIEFRLTELEGGDASAVAATPAPELGGGVTMPRPRPRTEGGAGGGGAAGAVAAGAAGGGFGGTTGDTQLAVTEQSDFDAAIAAADADRLDEAVSKFDSFLATYPGSPLSSRAQLRRSEVLAEQGKWQAAARGYLDTFSGDPQGPTGPEALFGLGRSLARIGKTSEACLTLDEVVTRYPGAPVTAQVPSEKASLGCQ